MANATLTASCLCGEIRWEVDGPLDEGPGVRPQSHIFVASRAPWDLITGGLPRHDEAAPA